MIQFLTFFPQKVLSILFPPVCYGCKKTPVALCSNCLQNARKSIAVLPPYVRTFFSYQDPLIKKSLHAIKYYHRKDLLHPLVGALAKHIKKTDFKTGQETVLVPIPMPRIRKYMRGYNQAELIATILSKQLNIPVNTTILGRAKTSKRQVTTRSRSERLKNQKHSFSINKAVLGLDIILVDDVTTTGATISEARDALLTSGAKNVRALTLAH